MGRHTIVPRVIEQVIDLIVQGQLKPGEQINQNNLAQDLGVSTTPLREALHALAGEGLMRFTKGCGVQVSPLTTAGIIENTELALALETPLLRRSVPLLTEEDLDQLEETLDRIARLEDMRDWYTLTWSFYHRLLAPSGYQAFLEIIRKTIFQTMLLLPIFAKVKPRVRTEEPNLRTVLAACRRRDVAAAVDALETFNRKACQATVALIQERMESERGMPTIVR